MGRRSALAVLAPATAGVAMLGAGSQPAAGAAPTRASWVVVERATPVQATFPSIAMNTRKGRDGLRDTAEIWVAIPEAGALKLEVTSRVPDRVTLGFVCEDFSTVRFALSDGHLLNRPGLVGWTIGSTPIRVALDPRRCPKGLLLQAEATSTSGRAPTLTLSAQRSP